MDNTPAVTPPPVAPVVSPTGSAVLPSWLPLVGTVVVGLAGVVVAAKEGGAPVPAVLYSICVGIVGLGAALGISSQGVRKQA